MPARLGLRPTPVMVTLALGWIRPATIQNAAEEISPGTATSTALRVVGISVRARPSELTWAPMAAIMRSVWSRDRAGWWSTVGPVAESPASIRHDFTWALATGMSYSMGRRFPPRIASGARVSPWRPMMEAPICCSGWTMRPMGRVRNDASPVSTDRNSWPANSPDNNRIEVPLLPASSMSVGSCSCGPKPETRTLPGSSRDSIPTPIALRQAAVDCTSAPSDSPVTVAAPSAMALRINDRCETDLSPGTASEPPRDWGLTIVSVTDSLPCWLRLFVSPAGAIGVVVLFQHHESSSAVGQSPKEHLTH